MCYVLSEKKQIGQEYAQDGPIFINLCACTQKIKPNEYTLVLVGYRDESEATEVSLFPSYIFLQCLKFS